MRGLPPMVGGASMFYVITNRLCWGLVLILAINKRRQGETPILRHLAVLRLPLKLPSLRPLHRTPWASRNFSPSGSKNHARLLYSSLVLHHFFSDFRTFPFFFFLFLRNTICIVLHRGVACILLPNGQ